MIKILVGKTELKLLQSGVLRCQDPVLLEVVKMLSEDYVQNGYEPYPVLGKMNWIAEQLGGKITFFTEDD